MDATETPTFATIDDLKSWIKRDLSRWGAYETHVKELPAIGDWGCRIFSETHWYTIYANGPRLTKTPVGIPEKKILSIDEIERLINQDNDAVHLDIRPDGAVFISTAEMRLVPGGLGCTASSRKPRAGEDWHRGSDLADGPLSEDTWRRILADIVSYEMVKVHVPKEPRGEPVGQDHFRPGSNPSASAP